MTLDPLGPEFEYDLAAWQKVLRPGEDDINAFLHNEHCGPASPVILADRTAKYGPIPASRIGRPIDAFVLGLGEPSRRDVTKINGLPYRPRSQAWPNWGKDYPAPFFAQIRLTESRDIIGETPGDLLLIFADSYRMDGEIFEWQSLGIEDLPGPDDVPPRKDFMTAYGVAPPEDFLTAYGVRTRVMQYDASGRYEPGFPYSLSTSIKVSRVNWVPREHQHRDLQFVIWLHNVWPPADVPYPFINHPAPFDRSQYREPNVMLTLHSQGAWIGVDRNGDVHFTLLPP